MSFLIQASQQLTFTQTTNATELAAVLAGIQILSFANHPNLPQLFYALYELVHISTGNVSHMIQTWKVNSAGHTIMQNHTLTVNPNCAIACQLKVSKHLLAIQSSYQAMIFPLDVITQYYMGVDPFKQYTKVSQVYFQANIYQYVDIHDSVSVHVNSSHLELIVYNVSNPITPISQLHVFNINPIGQQLNIIVSHTHIIWGVNTASPTLNYICMPCIIAGDYANNTNLTYTTITTNYTAQQFLQLASGQDSSGNVVLWANADWVAHRYEIKTSSSWSLLETTPSLNVVEMYSSNSYNILFKVDSYYAYRFYTVGSNSLQTIFSINQNFYEIVSLNSDSTVLSIYDFFSNVHAVTQYQMVGACSNYMAQEPTNVTGLCTCYQYDTIFCAPLTTTTSQSSSFPIYGIALIALAGAGVVVLVSWLIFKKFFSQAAKRTPYVYVPTELMSFQI